LGCKQANCALVGGETAEMPSIYKKGDYDLAGFAVGAVERSELLPKKDIKEGDIILGLGSSGFHSNGFSLIRYIIKQRKIDINQKFSNNQTLGRVLLEPTKIYVKSCLSSIKTGGIKALAHITGGGLLENIPRVLPANLVAEIDYSSWVMPEIFSFFQDAGKIKDKEMHRTFNCGIGMVVVCDKGDLEIVKSELIKFGEEVFEIGKIKKKSDLKLS
jgi:phosphoribosylformylglycinamidine cyclo-ligase